MNVKPLTSKQQRVLAYVSEFLRRRGFPPTLREIGDAIGLANINAVRGHVTALEKKGYITKTPDKARSIQLVRSPSTLSRAKRKLHKILGTDDGVFHRVVYGLAWTTRRCTPYLTGRTAEWMREAFDREAAEHGWTPLDVRIEPDHVVVTVETWPDHSAQRTVRRLQAAGNALKRHRPDHFPAGSLWGKGYAVTTDLELLDELVVQLLDNQRTRDSGSLETR